MYSLNKYFHPLNFTFPKKFKVMAQGTADDVYGLRLEAGREMKGAKNFSCSALTPLKNASAACKGKNSRLKITGSSITLQDRKGRTVLSSVSGKALGVSGKAWLVQFKRRQGMQFFGLGEKSAPFERSGRSYRFWNTDAYNDFTVKQIESGNYDPDYVSVPYLIIKQGNEYIGVLMHNPFPSVISLEYGKDIFLGAEDGAASLYILYGPSLAELTRKFQRLVGKTPLPPLWALGYQQCRWGYRGIGDLRTLAKNFETYKIPADGLWLDIDFMDGFRLFTFSKEHFGNVKKEIASIRTRGFHVVPIIDPGVKREKGYRVYDHGRKKGVFCKNAAGEDFTGLVWPGETVFPDFSLQKTRSWWTGWLKEFFEKGFSGAWLDMNDPSTGNVDCTGMLFQNGKIGHEAFHNQYALLMAKASRQGFMAAYPRQRPFLISRSGFTGSQQHAAVWTGDNCANYTHLRLCLGKTLNLALSGIPFNAPDVGGFAGDCSEQLMLDWVKANFLFPFMRNHSSKFDRSQEPWTYSKKALQEIRAFIRLRYKLLPYLYNLFIAQESSGEAILRPLFYDFQDTAKLSLSKVDDQFMVGSSIMQAPFVDEGTRSRKVVLPMGRWWEAESGRWLDGDRTITVSKRQGFTPLFIRDGSIIPMQKGTRENNHNDLNNIELYLFFSEKFRGKAEHVYSCDDGESFDYKQGKRTTVCFTVQKQGPDQLKVQVRPLQQGCGEVRFRLRSTTRGDAPGSWRKVAVNLFGKSLGFYELKTAPVLIFL